MTEIVRMVFGSHLYGTDTPESDRDYKAVFLPSGRDIIRQRAHGVLTRGVESRGEDGRNDSAAVDDEAYALHKFLELLVQGQTVALDMLFAPREVAERWHPSWEELRDNSARLVSRKADSFLGYCRRQANKYGIKGSRVAAARAALEVLDGFAPAAPDARVGEIPEETLAQLITAHGEHAAIVDVEGGMPDLDGTRRTLRHLEVCNRKMPFTQRARDAAELMRRVVAEYGKRALAAERNEGVDWKALSHAVRVGHESLELLATGGITFPRPERSHLVAIKLGRLEYKQVAGEIEDLLTMVEAASAASELPAGPDEEWIQGYLEREYLDRVKLAYGMKHRDTLPRRGW